MRILQSLLLLSTFATQAIAQPSDTTAYSETDCPPCKGWNEPGKPYHLHGSTYYVGTRGLAAILIASPEGHVLIDGGLPESAPLIRSNITSLGFRMRDVKLILNSHAHYDHAGGLAALQRMSGAVVAASARSAPVIRSGRVGTDDPQHAIALPFPAVSRVRAFADGDTLVAGSTRIIAFLTPGHTSGGTSWSWRSCEAGMCLDFVYADSQTPVSADGFLYTKSAAYPTAISDFESGFAKLERVPCDVLLTPHPGASNLWNRIARSDGASLVDSGACRRLATSARQALEKRKQLEISGGRQ